MITTHAVGIDLGTTYSCISYLNEHGEPVTLPNHEGELSTPSAILFDGYEVIVGTEALRQSILHPDRVIQDAKRFVGDPKHRWVIDGNFYSPVDVATFILKKLISAAEERIGKIEQAVITVPAQFSELQRQATVEAGLRAGLKRVDIINEPVAAALCHVLGTEGLWFTELAEEQRILVYDLGGGTVDLSLVKYEKNEVSVIASSGDLKLGGIDWNHALQRAICEQFQKDFNVNPQSDPESLQYLSLEIEQAKRSLSVRPRTALMCQHAGHRKTYQIEQARFEKLTKPLVERTAEITKALLKDNKMGWAHVDVVLTTGGASRMPMVRDMLKRLSGRTLNTSLSPDQSISHGATYYAGMLLTNSEFARSILNKEASSRLSRVRQQSVNARALGILIRDMKTKQRVPHYLIPANTPLPASATHTFGTVAPNQRRVHLHLVESGTSPDQPYVELGACRIENLPHGLAEGSEIAVTISYDAQARVHLAAKEITSGKQATTEIVREENLVAESGGINDEESDVELISPKANPHPPKSSPTAPIPPTAPQTSPAKPASPPTSRKAATSRPTSASQGKVVPTSPSRRSSDLEEASRPIPLCNHCGEPLNSRGQCPRCVTAAGTSGRQAGSLRPRPIPIPKDSDETHDQKDEKVVNRPVSSSGNSSPPVKKRRRQGPQSRGSSLPPQGKASDPGEEEFWNLDD